MTDCSINCPYSSRITKLEAQHDHLAPMINKLDVKLDQVIITLSRVEVLESKHNNHTDALERAFDRIETIEKQVSETSKVLADTLSQLKGMTRFGVVLWVALSGCIGFVFNKVL